MHLFKWQATETRIQESHVVPLSWEILAAAATRYSDEPETLDYVLRAARRLRCKKEAGFSCVGEKDGVARGFAWVAPYDGFMIPEIHQVLHSPSPESVVIFDCWTAGQLRDNGDFGTLIEQVAACVCAEGKDVWICSAAEPGRVAQIEKAGFHLQTSFVKRRAFFAGRTTYQNRDTAEPKQADALAQGVAR